MEGEQTCGGRRRLDSLDTANMSWKTFMTGRSKKGWGRRKVRTWCRAWPRTVLDRVQQDWLCPVWEEANHENLCVTLSLYRQWLSWRRLISRCRSWWGSGSGSRWGSPPTGPEGSCWLWERSALLKALPILVVSAPGVITLAKAHCTDNEDKTNSSAQPKQGKNKSINKFST